MSRTIHTHAIAWVRGERQARRILARELNTALALARFAHRFLEDAARFAGQQRLDRAGRVQMSLLSQLSLQLRSIELSSLNGYPLQALTGVATAYELAAGVGFIGRDPRRAAQWLAHTDPRKTYPANRRQAMRDLLLSGWVEAERLETELRVWEKRYEFYCMAKHGNPTVLRRYGIRSAAETVAFAHGPSVGPGYDTMSRYAIFRASQLLVFAATAFARGYYDAIPVTEGRVFLRRLRAAGGYLRRAALDLPRVRGAA